jgi:hypothetical protein
MASKKDNGNTNDNGKVREPETPATKKAAKAALGKTKGEGKAVKAAKADGQPKVKGPTIGARSVELLKSGKTAKETLEIIRAEFPGCKTQMASMYWYAQHNEIRLQKPAAKKEAKAA